MSTLVRIHKGCGGVVIDEPQDDDWGKWSMPVCLRCDQGPIVGREIAWQKPQAAEGKSP